MLRVVLLAGLGSWRLARLVVLDEFPPVLALRRWIEQRWGSDSWQAYLSQCVWCSTAWTSAAVVGGWWLAVGVPLPPVVWLASWAAASLTGQGSLLVDRVSEWFRAVTPRRLP